ncbi:MAG TPA: RDD family protein [Oligoflexia bacterium]|nr:RDD family protein [Oligoflexia bacterium]
MLCLKCGRMLAEGQKTLICKRCSETEESKSTSVPVEAAAVKPGSGLAAREGQEKYAGFWLRLCAFVVDGVILQTIYTALAYAALAAGAYVPLNIFGISDSIASRLLAVVVSLLVFLLIALLVCIFYSIVLEASRLHATLGKLVLGLEVVRESGEHVSFWHAVGRNAAKLVSVLPFSLGFVMAAFTARKQALHDKIARTLVVVRTPRKPVMVAVVAAAAILWSAVLETTVPSKSRQSSVPGLIYAPAGGLNRMAGLRNLMLDTPRTKSAVGTFSINQYQVIAADAVAVYDGHSPFGPAIVIFFFNQALSDAVKNEVARTAITDGGSVATAAQSPLAGRITLVLNELQSDCSLAGVKTVQVSFEKSSFPLLEQDEALNYRPELKNTRIVCAGLSAGASLDVFLTGESPGWLPDIQSLMFGWRVALKTSLYLPGAMYAALSAGGIEAGIEARDCGLRNKLRSSMRYEEVKGVLGAAGDNMKRCTAARYQWKFSDRSALELTCCSPQDCQVRGALLGEAERVYKQLVKARKKMALEEVIRQTAKQGEKTGFIEQSEYVWKMDQCSIYVMFEDNRARLISSSRLRGK